MSVTVIPRPRTAANARYPARDVSAALHERAQSLGAVLALVAMSSEPIAAAAAAMVDALSAGRVILTCGNGGSAAEAQHLSSELVGRFRRERDPWPAIALTADSAALTAIANDYGYDAVFARQVAAFGRPGDVLVGFSTSGESRSVVEAACAARARDMTVIALTGQAPSSLGRAADVEIAVPEREAALVQEVHAVLVHLLSEIVESTLAADSTRKVTA